MKVIYVEYEIHPLRAIYHQYFADDGQGDAEVSESFLWGRKPTWHIRKIERREVADGEFEPGEPRHGQS